VVIQIKRKCFEPEPPPRLRHSDAALSSYGAPLAGGAMASPPSLRLSAHRSSFVWIHRADVAIDRRRRLDQPKGRRLFQIEALQADAVFERTEFRKASVTRKRGSPDVERRMGRVGRPCRRRQTGISRRATRRLTPSVGQLFRVHGSASQRQRAIPPVSAAEFGLTSACKKNRLGPTLWGRRPFVFSLGTKAVLPRPALPPRATRLWILSSTRPKTTDEFSRLVEVGLPDQDRMGTSMRMQSKFRSQTSTRHQSIHNRRDIVAVGLQHPDVVI
jgi:hypothetical protein